MSPQERGAPITVRASLMQREYDGEIAAQMFDIACRHGFDWIIFDADFRRGDGEYAITAYPAGMVVQCNLTFATMADALAWVSGAMLHESRPDDCDKAFAEIHRIKIAADAAEDENETAGTQS